MYFKQDKKADHTDIAIKNSTHPDSEKTSKRVLSTSKRWRPKWWQILLTVILLLIIIAGIIYYSVHSRIFENKKLVNTWDELQKGIGQSDQDPGTASIGADGNLTLNDSDFDNIKAENYPIIKVAQKDPNIENILLLGIDNAPGESIHRSDSIIVASINTANNTLKLTSILRDNKVYFPERKAWGKLNAAYAYGGAGQSINIINYNFKLDIQKYVTVNFSGFQNIINAAGGVSIKVTAAEATQIDGLKGAGTYTLNGAQALEYSRIREIDTDFLRTQRQRNTIMALYNNSFKNSNVFGKTAIGNECINYIKTNIPTTDLISNYLKFASSISGNIDQLEVPKQDNGLYTTETSPVWYFDLNWDGELAVLNDFIYGK